MAKLTIHTKDGKKGESIDLPEDVFKSRVKSDIIHQAVVMYQASLRQGNASTKERADKSGGGKKPHRQKGTGRARAGSSRSPLWHGGGVTFGPHPRDFSYSVPKKIRRAALRESLKSKHQSEQLTCLEDLTSSLEKTNEFAKILKALKIEGRTLAVLDGSDESIRRVTKNIPRLVTMRSDDVNAYDIMRNKNLLVTKTAIQRILERLEK